MKMQSIQFVAFLAIIVMPALVLPAMAGPRDDVRAGSARCDGIADDRTWLDCYYGAAQPMRAKLGLPPAPNAQQALVSSAGPAPVSSVPQSAVRPVEKPGFWTSLLAHKEDKSEPPTHMTSYKFDQGGFFVVTLANGEAWKQSAGDAVLAKWRGRPESYTVTILPSQGLENSKMKVGNNLYQVEQVN